MMRRLIALFVVAAAMLVPAAPTFAAADDDIAARLAAIPGMTVTERPSNDPAYRFFLLSYRQPVDHRHPAAGTFSQRINLLHRDTARPMVLYTGGYGIGTTPGRTEPTRLVDGNQLSVEQRFFNTSRPQPADWTKLNIWQAASDHHRIVQALKPIYPARWLSTGASKGGMTSVYHRRFYPSDVDATIAYVAPDDVIDPIDRYSYFLDHVGTDPACRAALRTVQQEALRRRDEIVARYSAQAAARGQTFTRSVGSADRAFEMLVLDLPWGFWQYGTQAEDCPKVPPAGASTDQLWTFLDDVAGFDSYTDQDIDYYIPYYYQAGTQLGSGQLDTPWLRGLLRYPGLYSPRTYVPRDIPMRFDYLAMPDVDLWVKLHASRMLFVYGQNDPWGAEPFRLGPGTRDSLWFQVAGGNHGSNIAKLAPADRDRATAAVQRWAGVSAPPALRLQADPALDTPERAPRRMVP
jgi:hypothetical protein